jgi:acetolactate synthase-1/2/3 large subunit
MKMANTKNATGAHATSATGANAKSATDARATGTNASAKSALAKNASAKNAPVRFSGARIITQTLIAQGVTDVFGYPGGTVLGLYDELYAARDRLTHHLSVDEAGAVHAADGYARVSGRVGVVFATSGPGATNLVTGLAGAYMDSTPLVALTGNVPVAQIGRDSFQEVDIVGVTLGVTKHNFVVKDIRELEATLCEAFQIAQSDRPGPVLVDIPKDLQSKLWRFKGGKPWPLPRLPKAIDKELARLAEVIADARRPFIYVGGGVLAAEAELELAALAERIDAVVGCSLMGLTALPATNPRKLGLTGMHGSYAANRINDEADLIIALGTRFSDRATGSLGRYRKGKAIIHIDIDRAELEKNLTPVISVCADLRDTLTRLLARLGTQKHPAWMKKCADLLAAPAVDESDSNPENPVKSHQKVTNVKQNVEKTDDMLDKRYNEADFSRFSPQNIISAVRSSAAAEAIVATDVGQHQMWVAQSYRFDCPRTFVTSGGLGEMGFGLGAAIGASIALGKPNGARRGLLFTSDGSFHMDCNELATAVSEQIPLTIILMDNAVLGMVRQWQRRFFEGHYFASSEARKTDYVKLAEAFGASAFEAADLDSLRRALLVSQGLDGPALIHCPISPDEQVLPMIPPGKSFDDVIVS